MKRVTTDEFIEIAVLALAAGKDYTQTTQGLSTEDEVERVRQNGTAKEILESDLITPAADYTDDGERIGGGEDMEWLEDDSRGSGRYAAVGWTSPPDDPEYELMVKVEAILNDARSWRLHDAIRTLSKQEQAVIHAMFWDCTTQADIARGLGISRQAVHSAYSRALDKLREVFGFKADAPSERLTQEEMTARVFERQRRHGAGVAARLARMREARLA
jgi:RNA polymerase sigma factor (sigma-70 family)